MIKQLTLGAVLGAVVLFGWSFVAWTFVPWPGEPLRSFTNDEAIVAAIKANAPRSGNYLLPSEVKRTAGMTDEQFQKASQDSMNRMMQGPIIFTAIRLEPFGSFPRALVFKFVTLLVAALLATLLLVQTNGLSYGKRVLFLTIPAALIFLGTNADEWNWFGFSNSYTAMQLSVLLIGWFLAGLVMAIFVRGKSFA
ncbi:MAG TPA: hypothetical protein VKD91_00890 [Pyrinomonadaceae bacterium]|nr:hypothetical protein [Pyrinomonadaceae bacterium]